MLFLLAAFCCFVCVALSAPVFCPIEDLPWVISDIVIFTSNMSSTDAATASSNMGMSMGMAGDITFTTESFIDFTFCDANKGLELEVECSRFANGSLADDENFYPCDPREVVFQYTGHSLEIQRAFKSPCLGEPPYNGAIAFGRADVETTTETSPNGTLATQTRMEMPISSLS